MKKPASDKCISQCSARYRFSNIELDDGNLIPEIVEKIKALEHILGIQRCNYCGTIWAELYKENGSIQTLKIGTRDISDGKMLWFL